MFENTSLQNIDVLSSYSICFSQIRDSNIDTAVNSFCTTTHFRILFIIHGFYQASETHEGIKTVQTLPINLLSSMNASQCP